MEATELRYTGTKIGDVLKVQGRRQDWLADQVGLSRSALNMAMKGSRTINAEYATQIAAVLGVPFFMLFESPVGSTELPIGNSQVRTA